MPLTIDADFLGAALVGYQEKLKQIESRMADVRHKLRVGPSASSPTATARAAKKWKLSAEGRANIVTALKKRWAAKKAASAPAPPKPSAKKAPVKRGRIASASAAQRRAATKKAIAEVAATPPPSTQTGATD